ncbi:MAG TPA: class I SAM-dependent DNA methyltransferase [Arachnia sp.]|jgi:type I restriction enzyme M protein|nr:class I SAM-dependent DNA methyltransferase [Arachnia sp.]HMR13487.1 class I SAM-dependent DNA methyltransferase [Arachnia sp.]
MARKPAALAAPSTAKELKDLLWKSADKLRGSMDASQYKDVVLGLVFLKYVSDAFEERQEQIWDELMSEGYGEDAIAEAMEDRDEYLGSQVFWVPPEARWSFLAANAKGTPLRSTGEIIDFAMARLMEENKALAGTLPRVFNRESVDARRLAELIDLFNGARFTGDGATKARDLLGEVYEYFLEKFARAEGKRGGEFYTPAGVVRVLVEVLRPTSGRVYDPCCGSGGMFVQAERFLEVHHRSPGDISVYGQELNERTWRMAKMNLAIHGILGNLGPTWGDTFSRDLHPDLKADVIMANPPFNIKDWARREDDARWAYGVPPAGNANYAWLQHILSKLAPGGQAGVVMANGSMSSNSGGEGQIRAEMVEADVVACMVALPTQLFRSTGIPVCVWFLAKDKGERRGQTLFIDARALGHMVDRAERALSDDDIARIADTFAAWRGIEGEYEDVPGFARSATTAEIKAAGYALTPGRYVGTAPTEDDGEPLDEKVERLTKELFEAMDESARLDAVVREQLGRLR